MALSKKAYEVIAAQLLAVRQEHKSPTARRALDATVVRLSALFADENPRFNPIRFSEACGMTHERNTP